MKPKNAPHFFPLRNIAMTGKSRPSAGYFRPAPLRGALHDKHLLGSSLTAEIPDDRIVGLECAMGNLD